WAESRPPRMRTSQCGRQFFCETPTSFASRARTTACAPNSLDSSVISPGRSTAAVLTVTLSAPARTTERASSRERMPPPAVSGMEVGGEYMLLFDDRGKGRSVITGGDDFAG